MGKSTEPPSCHTEGRVSMALKLPVHSYCADVNSRWGLKLIYFYSFSTMLVTFVLRALHLATPLSLYVTLTLCGLLCAGVPVVQLHNITTYCLHHGICLREEISQHDLLQQRHPVTVSHWNSVNSLERLILSQMFVQADCMA